MRSLHLHNILSSDLLKMARMKRLSTPKTPPHVPQVAAKVARLKAPVKPAKLVFRKAGADLVTPSIGKVVAACLRPNSSPSWRNAKLSLQVKSSTHATGAMKGSYIRVKTQPAQSPDPSANDLTFSHQPAK